MSLHDPLLSINLLANRTQHSPPDTGLPTVLIAGQRRAQAGVALILRLPAFEADAILLKEDAKPPPAWCLAIRGQNAARLSASASRS
jgi:hypothetical protein